MTERSMGKSMVCVAVMFLLLAAATFPPAPREVHGAITGQTVTVLPFDAMAAGEYAYLGPALEKVLASRFAQSRGIVIIENEKGSASLQKSRDHMTLAGADYAVSGKIEKGDGGVNVTLLVVGKDSPLPVSSRSASDVPVNDLVMLVERFAGDAAAVIAGAAKTASVEKTEEERPALLSPVPGSEGGSEAGARMHPDRVYLAGGAAGGKTAEPKTAERGNGERGWTVQESWPQGAPRPTLGEGGQAGPQGVGGGGAGEAGLGDVPSFPEPAGERPVLFSSAPARSESRGILERLNPFDGGGDEKIVPAAPGVLPYPTPEELDAGVPAAQSRQSMVSSHVPPVQAPSIVTSPTLFTSPVSSQVPIHPETIPAPPVARHEEARKGWLSRLVSLGKGNEGSGKVRTADPSSSSGAPVTTGIPKDAVKPPSTASGPVWQWY